MLKGADLSQRIEFSSESDKENPTIFVMRPLSGIEMLEITKHVKDGQLVLTKEYIVDVLGMAIEEVKNPDIKEKEKIIEFIISLNPPVLMELVGEASNVNKFSEEEEKNS